MKKILLFLFVFFIALNVDVKAQNIDSLVVGQPIACPGGVAILDAYLSQSVPPVNYNLALLTLQIGPSGLAYQLDEDVLNTQITFYSFTGLQSGMYRVLITDPSMTNYPGGQGAPTDPLVLDWMDIFIPGPGPLFMEAVDDTLECWDQTIANLTVTFSGLTAPYFTWLEDNAGNPISGSPISPILVTGSSHTYSGLSAGDYVIYGNDNNNCGPEIITHTITAPDTLRPNPQTIQEISCNQAGDGELSVDVTTGGTPPYTYLWTGPAPAAGSTAATVSNLGPGTYSCTVTDDLGCDSTVLFTLIEPQELSASVDTIGSNDCNGDCDVEISVTIISPGQGGPYTYFLDGIANPVGLSTFANQCAGSYTVDVQDAAGCAANTIITNPVVIPEPDPIIVYAHAKDYNGWQVSCFGSCDGEITIDSVTGGNLPTYGTSLPYLGGVAFSVDTIIDLALCGGTSYTDTVTDALGCIGTFTVVMDEPPLFNISHTVAIKPNNTNLSCASSCDGEITVTPFNGVDTISYYYINNLFAQGISPNSVIADSACATPIGGDTLIAIDANGCTDTNLVNLTSPPPFDWIIGLANENCALANGKAWVDSLNGGVSPYNYDWTSSNGSGPFANNDTISGLSYGWYYLEVTDALGCTFEDSAFVDSTYILVDYTVNVPCNGIDNGVININTNNVLLSEVTLLLIDTITIPNPAASTIVSYVSTYSAGGLLVQDPNIATIMTFTGLASTTGNEVYELRVELFGNPQGASGCDPESYYIEIGDSVSMDASLDVLNSDLSLTCFGDSTSAIEIKVFDTFIDDTGAPLSGSPNNNSFGANLSGGIFNTFVSNNAPFNVLFNPTPPPGIFNYLPAGNYTILVTSNLPEYANCIDTVLVDVIQPDSLEFTLAGVSPLCYQGNDGYAGIDTIFGGTSPYFYSWTDTAGNVLSNIDSVFGLTAGVYTLTAQDLNFCPAVFATIEIFDQLPITYDVDTINIDICSYPNSTGEFLITSSGGVGTLTYNWWDFDSTWTTTSNNPIGLNSEWFYFMVTDSNACTVSDSVFIPNGVDPMLDQSYINHISCFGASDGSYIAVVDSLNLLGSSASPFAFWNPNAAIPFYDPLYTPQDSLLGPDTIVIQIQDALGCQASDTIIIIEPELLEITHFDTLTYIGGYNVSCNGSLDGELTVHAIGGTRDYTFWLQDTSSIHPSSMDSVFPGIAAAYYEAFVEDANGCLDSLEVFINQPDSLLIDSFFIDTTIAGGWNISCNGFSDGQANIYASGGNQLYSYLWSNGDTTQIADTLSANITYSVTVTDPNGCDVTGSIILSEPSPLVINNITPVHLLCKGGDNGTATVSVLGATPGYTYLWDNANDTLPTYFNPNDTVASLNDTTVLADTLRAGTYNVEVLDANGCFETQSVTITEPSISITIDSLAVTQMTCFTYDNADVNVFTTGPQPTPYLYTLYNEANVLDTIYALNAMSPSPQGNVAFSGLSDKSYVVYVEDNLGCLDRDTFVIHPLDSVYIDTVKYFNVSCNGYDDGYIWDIVPMGGTPPYQYSVDGGLLYSDWTCSPPNPNTCPNGYIFADLAPDTYNVEIWDSNGCANSYQIIITEPSPMLISDSTSNYNNYQIACNGGTDKVWFDIAGGDAPYSITLGSTTILTNGAYVWTGLGQGVHTFIIEDINGCQQSLDINLLQPPSLSVSPIITDVFCDGASTGDITAVVSGGVGNGNGNNYTYQWFSSISPAVVISGETSYFIDNLVAGDYYIEVTDQNSCSDIFPITIGSNVLQIVTSSSTINNVGCYDDCDGSITVDVQGGVPSSTGAYTYLWDDPLAQTTQTAIGLCAGPYTCIVTDMAGCSETEQFTIIQPSELEADIQTINAILCNGDKGDLKVTTTGGSSPSIASYLWSSGSTTSTASNLIAGSYSCFVIDLNGCTDTAQYYLSEPAVLEDSIVIPSHLNCRGDNSGEIFIAATGGTPIPGIPPRWTYVLSPNAATFTEEMGSFTALSSGIYTVTITDDNGCTYTTNDIFVGEPDNDLEIAVDIYHETIGGPPCALNDAGATVFPTGGTPGYTIMWDGNTSATDGIFEPLSSGAYVAHTVIVTDANGCEVIYTDSLLGYENVFLPDYQDYDSATFCMGDQVSIAIDDRPGLSYEWTMSNDSIIGTNANLNVTTDSSWGLYENLTLTITDDLTGCSRTVTAFITTDDPDDNPLASIWVGGTNEGKKVTILDGTSVTLSCKSGYNTYSWTNSNDEELATIREFSLTPTNSGWYHIYVTYGSCIGYDSAYVAIGVIPVTGISPNGDTYNDDWYIEDLDQYDNSVVQLFNRWGEMLFEYTGNGDRITSTDFDWESLNIGTYYYIIDLGDGSLPQTGPLTIIK